MDHTLAKLIRASRGPVLLVTLGILLAVHQATGISFDRTFPVLIIVFGMMWLLERMAPRSANASVSHGATVTLPPMPPVVRDPLFTDTMHPIHREVYGMMPPKSSAPAPVPMPAPKPLSDEIPTAEFPVRQQNLQEPRL